MAGLEELYREIIIDHYRNPRNKGELEAPPAHRTEGFNPLCGDEVVITFELDGDTIADVKIGGQGCSISQASASMMSTAVKGKTLQEARELTRSFKSMMSIHEESIGGDGSEAEAEDAAPTLALGELEAMRGVVKFPVRIKCATLPWNTLTQGIDESA